MELAKNTYTRRLRCTGYTNRAAQRHSKGGTIGEQEKMIQDFIEWSTAHATDRLYLGMCSGLESQCC
jgi:hypothetical protein